MIKPPPKVAMTKSSVDPASRPSSPSILIKSKKYELAKKARTPPDKQEGPQLEMSISKMLLDTSCGVVASIQNAPA